MTRLLQNYTDYCGSSTRAVILAALLLLAWLWQAVLVTHGTFNFFGPEAFDQIFNFMFHRLTEGRLDMDKAVTDFETFEYDGKPYSYFNMFPAMLRAFLWPFTDLGDYQNALSIARLSCWVANALACLFQGLLIVRIFRNVKLEKVYHFLFAVVLCALFFCNVSIFMTALSTVYREPILWARVFSSLFILLLFVGLLDRMTFSSRMLWVMGLCAGLALHNRVTVAIGLYTCLCGLIAFLSFCYTEDKTGFFNRLGATFKGLFSKKFMGAFIAMFVLGVLALLVNYGRWDDPMKFANYDGYKVLQGDPVRARALQEGGLFNIRRIPEALSFYLFSNPLTDLWAQTKFFVPFDGKQEPSPEPLVLMQPVLFLLMFFGVAGLLCRGKTTPQGKSYTREKLMILWAILSFMITCFFILSFMYTSFRYCTDFQPFMLVLGCTGLIAILNEGFCRWKISPVVLSTSLFVLLLVGMFSSHRLMAVLKAGDFYTHDKHAILFSFDWLAWLL